MPTYTKPTALPEWAYADVVDPTSGQNNVIAADTAHKANGWAFKEKPPRQFFNWLGRLTHNWLAYLSEQTTQDAQIYPITIALKDENDTAVTTQFNSHAFVKRLNGEDGGSLAMAICYYHFAFKTAAALDYVYFELPIQVVPAIFSVGADGLSTAAVAYSKATASVHAPAAGFYSIPCRRSSDSKPMIAFGDTQALNGLPAATSFPILNSANDGYYIDGVSIFEITPQRL